MTAVDVAAVRPAPPLASVPQGAAAIAEYHDDGHVTFDDGGFMPIPLRIPVRVYYDGNDGCHTLTKFSVVVSRDKKRRRSLVKKCNACGKPATVFCHQCQKAFCHSLLPDGKGHDRQCFHEHFPNRASRRTARPADLP